MGRSTVFGFLLLLGSLMVSGAHADATPAAADDESAVDEEARVQFEAGRVFFNQGEFEKAAIAMKRAYELRPGYKILYYLGWAENETGNYSRALNAYNDYLSEAPAEEEADRIAEVKGAVKKLRALVGTVQIVCDVEGAKIKVDNETMGTTPMARPISVDIGKHEISVVDGTNELLTEVIRIAGGQEIILVVGAKKTADIAASGGDRTTKDADASAPAAESEKPRNKGRIAAFGMIGLAAAVAVGAGITGALALDKESEIWDKCPKGTCYSEDYNGDFESDQGSLRTLGITTDVLIGVASAAAVTGVVLLLVTRNKGAEKTAHAAAPSFTVGPLGLAISGRF